MEVFFCFISQFINNYKEDSTSYCQEVVTNNSSSCCKDNLSIVYKYGDFLFLKLQGVPMKGNSFHAQKDENKSLNKC